VSSTTHIIAYVTQYRWDGKYQVYVFNVFGYTDIFSITCLNIKTVLLLFIYLSEPVITGQVPFDALP